MLNKMRKNRHRDLKYLQRRQCKICSRPNQDNFKDESALILLIFAIIGALLLLRKRKHSLVAALVAKEINQFGELDLGYYNRKEESYYVEMDKPRRCSYNKVTNSFGVGKTSLSIGYVIPPQMSPHGSVPITPMPAELRGITYRQLSAILVNIQRRCVQEKWIGRDGNLLTPDKVTLYDVSKYIIIPYTETSKASFVETLPSTAGTQRPQLYVSHMSGEPFCHIISCIEQMIEDFKVNRTDTDDDRRGGGMTEDTPMWICAFANNPHNLEEDIIKDDPSTSGFAKAMEVTEFRTLFILDKDGIVFSRIWCILELGLLTKDEDRMHPNLTGIWAVYTAHEHIWYTNTEYAEKRRAVGIVPGGATSDNGYANITAFREQHFPMERLLKALDVQIEDTTASNDVDKNRILNVIADNIGDLDTEPPKQHPNYGTLNNAIQDEFGCFISELRAIQVDAQPDKVKS